MKKTNFLFFDGAFGTYYYDLYNDTKCEFSNILHSDRVFNIYKKYIDVGANSIRTNSFGANYLLTEDKEQLDNIIRKSYEIAVSAVGNKRVKIFADIGYINGQDVEPDRYIDVVDVFINCGAKNFIFETLAEYDVIIPAIDYIKSKVKDACVFVSFAVLQDGYSRKGMHYKDLLNIASKNENVDYIGLNCICGPAHMYNLISKLDIKSYNKKFFAMPNSGYPSTVNGRLFYEDNAEYFSNKLNDIYNLGLSGVGGCCGTTPEHIKLSIRKIKLNSAIVSNETKEEIYIKTEAKFESNNILNLLREGKKPIAVELDPPINANCDFILDAAMKLKLAGADIITIADSPLSRARADSIIIAAKIKREIGIEVLPHLSCRDRNHIGIKAALLGANIENINDILVVTGDPIPYSKESNNGMFSYNSFSLISYINKLNEELFVNSPYCTYAALNVNNDKFGVEIKRALKKETNGAKVFFSQPIYSNESISNLFDAYDELNSYIFAGIMPVISYKNAMFLNNEVYGINIPDDIVNRFKDKTPEECEAISLDFSMGIINSISDKCHGYYLVTSLRKVGLICELIKKIRKK